MSTPSIWTPCAPTAIPMGFSGGKSVLLATVVAGALLAPIIEAANLYRYRNDDGVTVVDFHIPAEYANRGYEVLNDAGVVIEVIPRALTDAEKADASTEARLRIEAAEEQARLQAWDESLLLRYSTTEDIEAARDRSLRDLKIRVSILKSNRRSLRQRVENAQARVAEAERLGRDAPEADLALIEGLKAEIESTERQILDRQAQIDEVYADYQRDIDRFQLLQDVVDLRRNLERPRP